MSRFAEGMITGHYAVSSPEELQTADFLIGHEYAAPKRGVGEGLVNEAIANYILDNYPDQEIYVAATIGGAIKAAKPNFKIAGVFDRISSDTRGTRGGTWWELQQAKLMAGPDKRTPILAGNGPHIGRVALQAQHPDMGLNPVLPQGLPNLFDKDSVQWWCRKRAFWPLREVPTYVILKKRGQI